MVKTTVLFICINTIVFAVSIKFCKESDLSILRKVTIKLSHHKSKDVEHRDLILRDEYLGQGQILTKISIPLVKEPHRKDSLSYCLFCLLCSSSTFLILQQVCTNKNPFFSEKNPQTRKNKC